MGHHNTKEPRQSFSPVLGGGVDSSKRAMNRREKRLKPTKGTIQWAINQAKSNNIRM